MRRAIWQVPAGAVRGTEPHKGGGHAADERGGSGTWGGRATGACGRPEKGTAPYEGGPYWHRRQVSWQDTGGSWLYRPRVASCIP